MPDKPSEQETRREAQAKAREETAGQPTPPIERQPHSGGHLQEDAHPQSNPTAREQSSDAMRDSAHPNSPLVLGDQGKADRREVRAQRADPFRVRQLLNTRSDEEEAFVQEMQAQEAEQGYFTPTGRPEDSPTSWPDLPPERPPEDVQNEWLESAKQVRKEEENKSRGDVEKLEKAARLMR